MTATITRTITERAQDVLRRAGNPFCNYFARNPDDEVCTRYHVADLYAGEREQLWALVDIYRYQPGTHSEVVPILGNKGSGKTHLLHSIKHGGANHWQLLVTPGTYQRDSEFLEYLLFQIIDTLLGGGKQRGVRPLQYVGAEVVRRLLGKALQALAPEQRLDLFPMPVFGRWTRKLGLGASQALERTQYLIDNLNANAGTAKDAVQRSSNILHHLQEVSLDANRACQLVCDFIQKTEAHNTAGLMRRHILQGFARAVLLGDEAELASFLTYGFAELEFHVRPSRQDLVLALFKVLMGVFLELKIPVVVAFDQLEDLLLARRSGDAHQVAEAFFAGIVQAMHQIDGVCFLIFAERGLWNRFVPSLDGYIQDRLNNPVHLPGHGTVKTLKLEAPAVELVRKVVEARLRPALEELPDAAELASIFPFSDEQVERIARTEPTLRDCLQQFRRLYDRLIYNQEDDPTTGRRSDPTVNRIAEEVAVKSVMVVETSGEASSLASPEAAASPRRRVAVSDLTAFRDLWDREMQAAREQLRPDGGLTGATRELQAGLADFLKTCHEHGVKVGPWRLQHVVGEFSFSEHPTYGVLTLAHWAIKDGQPWKVGAGLFLAKGPAKPKDLEIKLGAFEVDPAVVDHLILLRPEDDLALSGKSKTLWADAEKKGRHARLEPVSLDTFALMYGFPRWLAAVTESLPDGHQLPNLADFIQERCDKLLEQVCMPVQGGF